MTILGLDLATRTGWALCEDGKITESGAVNFKVQRGESPGMRYLFLRRWLDRNPLALNLTIYEDAHYRGGAATEVCVGMVTTVQEWCAARGVEHMKCHTQRLKKWFTGSGRASKADMMAEASRRTGRKVTDNDEADAIALALFAWDQVGVVEGGE